MKVASAIFTGLGLAINSQFAFNFANPPLTRYLMIVGIIFCISGIIAIANNYKAKWLGIFLTIFGSLLGGICYLCWDPEK